MKTPIRSLNSHDYIINISTLKQNFRTSYYISSGNTSNSTFMFEEHDVKYSDPNLLFYLK